MGAERSVAGLGFLFPSVSGSRAFLACPLSVGVALVFGARGKVYLVSRCHRSLQYHSVSSEDFNDVLQHRLDA